MKSVRPSRFARAQRRIRPTVHLHHHFMRRKLTALAAAVVAVLMRISLTASGQDAGKSSTPTVSPKSNVVLYESPKGDYRLERSAHGSSVVVVSVKNPPRRTLLPGADLRYSDYEASPDEQWLVSRDGELYQRVGETRFAVFKKKGWFDSELQGFVEKTFHPPSRHWIWEIVDWSDDSSRLKIGITWPEGEADMCFNVRTKEFERAPTN